MLLRILGRVKLGRSLDLSDYLMLSSCVAMLGMTGAVMSAIFNAGLGFHVYEIKEIFGLETGAAEFLKNLMVLRIMATLSLALSKISILVLCCRIFTTRWFRIIAHCTIGLIVLWAIGTILIITKACTPFEYNWDKTIPTGTCRSATLLSVIGGSVNILADFIVLVLPMPYIYKLQLATYKKVTLMITFGIGFIVCIVSMVKVALLPLVDNSDVTYSIQKAMILTILEVGLAIILACIPVLRPLFKNSMATKAVHQSRYVSRTYSAVPFTGQKTNGFTELQDISGHSEPLPMRPEKTYYSTVEAVGNSSEDTKKPDDVEMGGITVKKEFTARIEVVHGTDKGVHMD
ncbi:hypothetical protein N0V93_006961 [Gnomoniopsis smithogilvyi]|uniref:Rhodopsin domain-containing protein n=1 Tax=Gnomoniopsis smithogilvyi TaxID=1191159 RepID=A0A9W8YQN5_9PEZI|nr:hypothetical protein N0V93_006961 [Gnomoniopsis smithogilvyi]